MDTFKNKAEIYCARGEHCIEDVRTKLLQWGAPDDIITPIVTHLLANDYINEQRYCNAFAHDKLRYQKWGKKKIAYALHSKRIATNIIEDALKNIDETEYNTILSKLITQKKGATKEQVTRFCMQRGFEYSRINELLCYIDSETTANMD